MSGGRHEPTLSSMRDEETPGRAGQEPSDGNQDADFDDLEEGPAWAHGAGVRWFGVVVFLALGACAVLVLIATLLAIYDRARDHTPPPGAAGVVRMDVSDFYRLPAHRS